MTSASPSVTLEPVREEELPAFAKALQAAFAVAVAERFGCRAPMPPDEDVWRSFHAEGAEIRNILADGQRVGGAVLIINPQTRRNSLDLFFIAPENHGRGLGRAAWEAIERSHPETEVWVTATPYFEQRNIHFYVNICGFHIVEFFNPHHPDLLHPPVDSSGESLPGLDAYFLFEKDMRAKCVKKAK